MRHFTIGAQPHPANLPSPLPHAITTLILTTATAFVAIGVGEQAQSEESDRVPNIVLILADDK